MLANKTEGLRACGGGIFVDSGDLVLIDSTVSGNRTQGSDADGGGIYAKSGEIEITRSTLSDNSTSNDLASGGGILVREGSLAVTNSTISGNYTEGDNTYGGGIFSSLAPLTITSSTVAGNSTKGAITSFGGGIHVGSTPLTIRSSIVANNTSILGSGQDLRVNSGAITVEHSLIGNNQGSPLSASSTPDANGNLIGSNSSPIDPRLSPLTTNLGFTATHRLLPGSPAINAGDDTVSLATDQRGGIFSRNDGNGVDMGAYETQAIACLNLEVDIVADENDGDFSVSDLSLREAIALANISDGPNTITFAMPLFDTQQTIVLLGLLDDLLIDETLTILGPGKDLLSISGDDKSRVLNYTATSGDLTLNGLTVKDGRAIGHGGGILFQSDGVLNIEDSAIAHNRTRTVNNEGTDYHGGGIYNKTGDLVIRNSVIEFNSTAVGVNLIGEPSQDGGSGGGIYSLSGDISIVGSAIKDNTTGRGGRKHSSFGSVAGNGGDGGGIFALSGSILIEKSTIRDNQTGNSGIVTDMEESAYGKGGDGGGIRLSSGVLRVEDSTISGNKTGFSNPNAPGNAKAGDGGGIMALSSTVHLAASTISGNSASGVGGAIVADFTYLRLEGSTITANTAATVGGLHLDGSVEGSGSTQFVVRDSIIADNIGSFTPDILNLLQAATVNNSLIGDATATAITAGTDNLTGNSQNPVDPLQGPLASNGGPTQTHALLPGSPSLDAGAVESQVLDDFSTDQFATAYNFVDIFSDADNDPMTVGGQAQLNVGSGTGGFVWNGGESLKAVRDKISVESGFNYPTTTDPTFAGSGTGLSLFSSVSGPQYDQIRVRTDIGASSGLAFRTN